MGEQPNDDESSDDDDVQELLTSTGRIGVDRFLLKCRGALEMCRFLDLFTKVACRWLFRRLMVDSLVTLLVLR